MVAGAGLSLVALFVSLPVSLLLFAAGNWKAGKPAGRDASSLGAEGFAGLGRAEWSEGSELDVSTVTTGLCPDGKENDGLLTGWAVGWTAEAEEAQAVEAEEEEEEEEEAEEAEGMAAAVAAAATVATVATVADGTVVTLSDPGRSTSGAFTRLATARPRASPPLWRSETGRRFLGGGRIAPASPREGDPYPLA